MHLFLSAGEPSGDLHAANLARELTRQAPGVRLAGFGGDRLASTGTDVLYPLTDLAVMWLGRALLHLPKFLHLGAVAESYFRRMRPDAVIVVDFPGFHWHVARIAHRYGIPVYYFVPPQLWAWMGWRVKRVKKHFRCVLTALPFEETWYAERGVRTHYVGHPYFDELAEQRLDESFLDERRAMPGPIVAILPGSRTQEVTSNGPLLAEAASRIAARRPDVRFLVAAYKPHQAELMRGWLASRNLNVEIQTGRTPEIIELAHCCMAVSGSVSLELLVRRKPSAIVYQVGRGFAFLARQLATVKYYTLVNLLADRELMPEFFAEQVDANAVANQLLMWLDNERAYADAVKQLTELKAKVAIPGAVERAAEFILHDLQSKTASA